MCEDVKPKKLLLIQLESLTVARRGRRRRELLSSLELWWRREYWDDVDDAVNLAFDDNNERSLMIPTLRRKLWLS